LTQRAISKRTTSPTKWTKNNLEQEKKSHHDSPHQ
jgi:hypothetical protein